MGEVKKVQCHFCGVGWCGILVHVENGKIVKVTGNPSAPYGVWCGRHFQDDDGRPAIEYHYHADRLNYPLKREGERGEGKWKRISWDQALDEVAAKLCELKEKYGPETLFVCTGTAHMSDYLWPTYRFCNLFGTPNKGGNEQVCYGPMVITDLITFGWPMSILPVEARCYVLSNNIPESLPMQWSPIESARRKGTKIITIDPYLSESARVADIWLQIRPGTDAALQLCWIRTIIEETLFDEDFVKNWTNAPLLIRCDTMNTLRESDVKAGGKRERFVVWNQKLGCPGIWDPDTFSYEPEDTKPALEGEFEVKVQDGSYVKCKTVWTLLRERTSIFSPEEVEKITWIPAHKITEAARIYATTRPSLWLVHHIYDAFAPGSIDVSRGKSILKTITGNIGVTECPRGPMDPDKFVNDYELELRTDEIHPTFSKKKQIGADRFRLLAFPGYDLVMKYVKRVYGVGVAAGGLCQPHPSLVFRAMITGKPYPIKAMIVAGANPLSKFANTKLVYEAIKKLDLIVVLDMFITPTAALADYLFPMTDCLERPAFNIGLQGIFPFVLSGERAVKPEYERRDDYDFWRGLATRLGQEKYWPEKTLEEVYDHRIKPASGFKSFQEFVEKVTWYFKPLVEKEYATIDQRTNKPKGFATPTRKVEIWSVILEELGYDPLPNYKPPALNRETNPTLAKEYPLILNSLVRHLPNYHSEYYMIHSLRRLHPDPIVIIHPHTAARQRPPIRDGDWVWIETRRGRCKMKAKLTEGTDPRVIRAEHCWWFPELPEEEPWLHGVWQSNINVCTEDDPELCNPVCGSWPHSALPCKVYKCEEGPA
jgi:anaerobic selenocysteine-containing dehydrogenase